MTAATSMPGQGAESSFVSTALMPSRVSLEASIPKRRAIMLPPKPTQETQRNGHVILRSGLRRRQACAPVGGHQASQTYLARSATTKQCRQFQW